MTIYDEMALHMFLYLTIRIMDPETLQVAFQIVTQDVVKRIVK